MTGTNEEDFKKANIKKLRAFEKSRQNDQFTANIMNNYSRRNTKLGLTKRKMGSLAKIYSEPHRLTRPRASDKFIQLSKSR